MSKKIMLLVVIIGLSGCSQSDLDRCNSTGTAYVMSNNFVKQQLKSPSTAVFPRSYDSGVHVENVAQCTHEIMSYVDSQNGFGATVRTTYYAKVKRDLNRNNWRLIDLRLND